MRLLLLCLAVIGLSVQSAFTAPADKVDCSKIDEVLDDMGGAQGFSTLHPKYKLSTTADEYNKRCQEMSDAIKTLRKYNQQCYSSLTQQVFSAVLRTRAAMTETHCVPDSAEAKAAVEATKCLQENAFEPVKEAEKNTILSTQALFDANIADDKLRMRRACCGVLKNKASFLAATKEKCSKHEKLYSDYVDSYTSEAMGLICDDAEKLDCGKLEALKIENTVPKNTFFLTPMLKVVKTLDH